MLGFRVIVFDSKNIKIKLKIIKFQTKKRYYIIYNEKYTPKSINA